MKLVVDEQTVEVIEAEDAALRLIIERISDELKEKNRVISEIYLDGKAIGGWDDPQLTQIHVGQCNHLRLISQEPRKLAQDVLREIAQYMPRIQQALIETSSKIQSRQEEEGMQLLEQVTSTWAELYQGLQSALTVTGVDVEHIRIQERTFLELNNEIQQFLEEVMDLVQDNRLLELSDILEYEIAPRMPVVEEGIYRIIREADRKPH